MERPSRPYTKPKTPPPSQRQPRRHEADQAAIVDRLLKKLRHADPDLVGRRAERPGAPRTSSPIVSPAPFTPDWRRPWLWTSLAVGVGVGLTQWPYAFACGLPLAVYAFGLLLFLSIGTVAGISSWRHRRAIAHVVALILVVVGLGLAADLMLPRLGYAYEQATWWCQ